MTASLRLSFGERWAQEAAWLDTADVAMRVDAVDLDVLKAPVDVVLGRRNITERVPPEPLLPFVRRWCDAWIQLASGNTRKAIVVFDESPFEFALTRDGDAVELTLYRVGRPTRALLEREPVALADALEATQGALRQAAARCASRRPISARLGARLHAAAQRIAALEHAPARAWLPALGFPLEVSTDASSGDAMRTVVELDDAALRAFDATRPLDRHVLLARGEVLLLDGHGGALSLPGRPLETLEHLTDALSAVDVVGTQDVRLAVAEGLRIDIGARSRAVTVSVGAHTLSFALDAFWSLVGEHVAEVAEGVCRARPPLQAAARLSELRHTATVVRRRIVHAPATRLGAGASTGQTSPRAPGYARQSAGGAPPATLDFPAASVRHMRLERLWTTEVLADDAPTWRACPDGGWWGREEGALVWRDTRTGRRTREAPLPPAEASLLHVGAEVWSLAQEGVEAFGPERRRWSLELEDAPNAQGGHAVRDLRFITFGDGVASVSVSGEPALRWRWTSAEPLAKVVPLDDVQVVALDTRRLVGLDNIDGRVAWSLEVPFAVRLSASCGLLFAWPRSGPGELLAIEPGVGAIVARHAVTAPPECWDVGRRGAAWCMASQGGSELVMFCPTRRGFASAPARGPVEHVEAHGSRVCALGAGVLWSVSARGTTWRARTPWALGARFVRENLASGLCALIGDESLRLVEAWTGAELAEVRAFWETVDRVALGPRGDGLLIERPTRDGGCAALHGVPAVGMLAALDGGRND